MTLRTQTPSLRARRASPTDVRTVNGGKRLRGRCPHPRAPGALALSLDRERDLEKQGEGLRKGSKGRGKLRECGCDRSNIK